MWCVSVCPGVHDQVEAHRDLKQYAAAGDAAKAALPEALRGHVAACQGKGGKGVFMLCCVCGASLCRCLRIVC